LLCVDLRIQEIGFTTSHTRSTFWLEVINLCAYWLFVHVLHVIKRVSLDTLAAKIPLTLSLFI
jgi:hypothetical protein